MTAILIVDDDPAFREGTREILEAAGYQVLEAADGRAAERLLKAVQIHLVLCDLFMPDQDGLETISSLRKRAPELPVIAVSGAARWGGADYLLVAQKLGARAAISKPLHAPQMLSLVEELLA